MSYDICLKEPGTNEVCTLTDTLAPNGGTYAIGGTNKAEFNITWNYAKYYYELFPEKGIRTIYGMTGAASIPLLVKAILSLKDDVPPEENYWTASEGNAKKALEGLLTLASECPAGVWDGD